VNLVILSPVRLLREGLRDYICHHNEISVLGIVPDLACLRSLLAAVEPDAVLIDVTHGIDLADLRSIAAARADLALVALGLPEQRQEVIRCGQAGFAGYICRDATLEVLCKALADAVEGKLACPAEISGGLMRALFRSHGSSDESAETQDLTLTRRESDVLRLLGQGLSNKEIARELVLSVATVKHHVHNVLDKLKLPRRTLAMRRVRDAPWLLLRRDSPLSRRPIRQ